MLRLASAVCVLIASTASAQVIFMPPEVTPNLDAQRAREHPHAMELMRVLRRPPVNIYIQSEGVTREIHVFSNGTELFAPAAQQDQTIYDDAGRPLFFRMRDLLPPQAEQQEPAEDRAGEPATTQPSTPAYEHQGEIVIKPWRGGARTNAR